jgi:hypothetical protein
MGVINHRQAFLQIANGQFNRLSLQMVGMLALQQP